MTEPDVALTDYGLALECALFVYLLARRGASGSRSFLHWFIVLFSATALAAATGGTVHGFFNDESTVSYEVLWRSTLMLIGASALSVWIIGARISSAPWLRWIPIAALVAFVAYCGIVVFLSPKFVVAVAFYLPASIFLLVVLVMEYRRTRASPALAGVASMILGFAAAVIQQTGICLHPVWFNHNALYHVIQAVALVLLFITARWLIDSQRADAR